jgi:hypothetical protein
MPYGKRINRRQLLQAVAAHGQYNEVKPSMVVLIGAYKN